MSISAIKRARFGVRASLWIGWFLLLFCPVASIMIGQMGGGLEKREESRVVHLLNAWDRVPFLPDIHWWMQGGLSPLFVTLGTLLTMATLTYLFWGHGHFGRKITAAAHSTQTCPRCEYDLRGTERCPECGYQMVPVS